MATVTDVEVANASFPNVRQDLNDILEALATNFSADAEPTTTYPNQFWYETDSNLLYIRNEADDAWITLALINQATGEWEPRTGVIQAIDGDGLELKTDDGVTRVTVSDSGQISFENYSFPTADGSDGQVLKTDGAGNLSFGSVAASAQGLFRKADPTAVAWTKTGTGTAETQTQIDVEVNGTVLTIASGTSIDMPSLSAGTDYAIWTETDGSLQASSNHTTPPSANARKVGGFHYAPGGNASFDLDAGDGGTTPQINEFSFYDLKWRPSAADPRGLTLVGDGAFWTGIYLMSANHLTGPVHKYNVNPCRDGNPPELPDGSGNYPDAQPSNIFEALQYHGFRAPNYQEFQLLAYGTDEARSIGGSGPGNTGDVSDRGKDQQTSHWGVFDSTGVLLVWGTDHILEASNQTLPNPSRGGRFRFSRFALFGGRWDVGSESGSRHVDSGPATFSLTTSGGRGVCDHLILD